ncbi:hypothetical protein QJS66_10555 [Kocuria rhizophila]|nr:hypothetical protein QJS66_10555 [Kocuria rhizophila]
MHCTAVPALVRPHLRPAAASAPPPSRPSHPEQSAIYRRRLTVERPAGPPCGGPAPEQDPVGFGPRHLERHRARGCASVLPATPRVVPRARGPSRPRPLSLRGP